MKKNPIILYEMIGAHTNTQPKQSDRSIIKSRMFADRKY